MSNRVSTLIGGRRERLAKVLGSPLPEPVAGNTSPLTEQVRTHLLEEAEELYWNELEWERITAEESLGNGSLVELTFPGFLAFIRGLLLQEPLPDAKEPPEPRPQVVEDVLRFLGSRVVELEEELSSASLDEPDRFRGELALTNRLIDHVLYRYHGLSDDDVERVESARVPS